MSAVLDTDEDIDDWDEPIPEVSEAENLDVIYSRTVVARNPFKAVRVPFEARVYQLGYDHSALGKPGLIHGWRTPFRLAAHALLRSGLAGHGKAELTYDDGRTRAFRFCAGNTQSLHSYVLDRYKDGYEPEVCAVLDTFMTPDTVFCDLGANSGYFVGYVGSRQGFRGEIHAFEPLWTAQMELQRFVSDVGLNARVEIYEQALSDKAGFAEMVLPDRLHSGLAQVQMAPSGSVAVKKLDEFSLTPDIIKIDVEGYEGKAIKGATRTITHGAPVIIFESYTNPKAGPVNVGDADPFCLLNGMGYVMFQPAFRHPDNHLSPVPPQGQLERELVLIPFDGKKRAEGPVKINVVAIPLNRMPEVTAKFDVTPYSHDARPLALPRSAPVARPA